MNAPDIALTSEELTTLEHEVENLIGFVNESMSNRSDISELIGMSSTEMMQDNHRNSARFILTSVSIGDFRKLKDTMPWVYATYHNHGFSYQYFAIVFETWIQAVHKFIDPPLSEKYAAIYEWLSEHHKDWIELSQHYTSENIQPPKEWSRIQDQFLNALLAADTSTCLELANTHIQTHTDVQHFYLDVIQPSLYEIGIYGIIMRSVYPRSIWRHPLSLASCR
ncbi:MAG: hypothetical protein U5R06_13460 [candidate division KSB1 bacterium]|nr:hypothetical protein [candidate division KSB1 bacterium]